MTEDKQLRWVRPPVQERSQETMERLLVAAEELIVDVGFEKATIADIAKRAESSVGAFYARFRDKDALLHCLFERFVSEAKATLDSAMRPELWQGVRVASLTELLLRFSSKVMRERRLFVLALSQASMEDESLADFRGTLSVHAAGLLVRLIESRDEPVATCNLEKTMRVVTWTCMSVLEAGCLHDQDTTGGVPNDEMTAELCTMIVQYLGLGNSG